MASENSYSLIKKANCLQKVDTLLNADTTEFCPFQQLRHILLCGTYKLDESSIYANPLLFRESTELIDDSQRKSASPQVRLGGVKVFHVELENEVLHLKETNSLDLCGVLDMKWPKLPPLDQTVFALVDAEGCVQVFKYEAGQTAISPMTKGKLSDSSMGLSLEWNQGKSQGHKISCSDSAGFITIYDYGVDLSICSQWSAHNYEAWITAFHQFDDNVVYTGGDDCLLKTWDLRDTSRPVLVNRQHQMGVCSVQSHPFDENVFASGSYDEQLFVWDRRNPKSPLTATSLGGGIWRIKWEPNNAKYILTATMYNGTHIIGCDDLGKNPLPILAHYSDHNLAYGADWCHCKKHEFLDLKSELETNEIKGLSTSFLISTCSFYDHSLHLWEWKN